MKKTVLVTGGAGYIGSHTVVELVNGGFEVVIVDDFSNSSFAVIDNIKEITGIDIKLEQIDCCDRVAMHKIFTKYNFDAVIHFAAFKAVGESVDKPLEYYKNNILSLVTVLELVREFKVRNIVFSSSCTVYGQPDVLPATEMTPHKKATSPYGNSKQMCEDILEDLTIADKSIYCIALRYFNPIGAHHSALLGEIPKGIPNNLLPYLTQTAAGELECLNVFGDDYNTPDGSAIRDYIDVLDLAKAHVHAVRRMLEGKSKARFEFFNIGTGRGVSVLELIKKFEQVNNIKVNYKITARRSGDIESMWADCSLANNELGWKATTTLETTLKNAWKWQLSLKHKN